MPGHFAGIPLGAVGCRYGLFSNGSCWQGFEGVVGHVSFTR